MNDLSLRIQAKLCCIISVSERYMSSLVSRLLTMRAIVVSKFGNPEVLKLQENVAIPRPSKSEVLVRIHSAGVNPVDTYIRTGQHAVKPDLPYTPGKDGAGVIEETGSDVSNIQRGQRVWFLAKKHCAYAEYACIKSCEANPLDDKLTFAQGASLGVPYLTAYRALFVKGAVAAKSKVLVHGGSGAVGIATIELASAAGCEVFATGGTARALETMKERGASHVFNHRDADYAKKIMEASGGEGLDMIVEMLANVNLDQDSQMLKRDGAIKVIGSRGRIEINPRDLMLREASITGVMLGNATAAEMTASVQHIQTAIAKGHISPLVGREFPLGDASQAHIDVIEHTGGSNGKIVLDCTK